MSELPGWPADTPFAVSQPWAAPLYPNTRVYYRDAGVIFAYWEADTDKVAELLPPGVEPLADPVVCGAWISAIGFSTPFGPYNEMLFQVQVKAEGQAYNYIPFGYADSDMAIALGREVSGTPKKSADMKLTYGQGHGHGEQFLFTVDRPADQRLLSIGLACDRPAQMDELPSMPSLGFRIIPNCEAGKPPSLYELVSFGATMHPRLSADGTPELWAGRCSVNFDAYSEVDPIQKMSPTRLLGGFYGRFDWGDPQRTLVKNYLA